MRTQREIQQRAPLWLGLLLVANLILMSYDARDEVTRQRMIRVWGQAIASPVQRLTSTVGGTGVGFIEYLSGLRYAAQENEELKKRLAEAEAELRDSRSHASENERLKALLDLKQEGKYEAVAAKVIGRDPSAWFDSIIINRGRMAGVELGMPVVTPEGIVGRVVATSPLTAQVTLITDERSAAGAVVGQLGSSNALSPVRGQGESDLLKMSYVPGIEQVSVGDRVWTTGQDSIYPAGLSVGQVVEIKQGTATTPHVVYVRPSAKLGSLAEVTVLKYHPSEQPPLDQTLPNVAKKKK